MSTPHSPLQESFYPSLFPSLHLPPALCVVNTYAVEVLHYIQVLKRSNAIAKKRGSRFALDATILYQALEHLMSGTRFTEWELTAYFNTQLSLEEFHRTLDDSLQETLEVHLPYPVDFQLLGLDATSYSLLDHNSRIVLHQQYEILYFELLERYSTVPAFIASAQKMLKNV